MIEVITGEINRTVNKTKSHPILIRYLYLPFRSGLWGFGGFLMILSITKVIGLSIESSKGFFLSKEDIELSLLGFLLLFSIRLLRNLRLRKPKLKKI